MRFENITIENFRAIKHVDIDAANGSMIVIAGPNGCGKSCIFDAIRFVKSAYGGYEDNEWATGSTSSRLAAIPAR